MSKQKKSNPYVIIGNSVAAIGCVEGIRSVDQKTPIVLLSREPERAYSRPLISYLLGGCQYSFYLCITLGMGRKTGISQDARGG